MAAITAAWECGSPLHHGCSAEAEFQHLGPCKVKVEKETPEQRPVSLKAKTPVKEEFLSPVPWPKKMSKCKFFNGGFCRKKYIWDMKAVGFWRPNSHYSHGVVSQKKKCWHKYHSQDRQLRKANPK